MKPNIVLILCDDMGFSDLGCYGGELRTPHLDRLAAGGIRFTQFYNTARCCPSRASLLSGLHPHQTGVGGMVNSLGGPEGYEGTINNRCVTIAEVLKDAGYAASMSGKWHLSGDHIVENQSWPISRGFDRYYGIITGAADYFAPRTLMRDHNNVEREALDDPGYYITDAISENAVDHINDHFDNHSEKPLFEYVAYTAPHWPLHAPEEDIARCKGQFSKGWDILREERMERLLESGLIDPDWALSPRDSSQPAWTETVDQQWQLRRMEVYAAQIEAMDRGIGRIVDALESRGQLDNTLILFLADNGGAAEEVSVEWLKQGWMQDLCIIRHRAKNGTPVRFGNSHELVPGGEDTYSSYGVAWANLSNTPFRLYKGWVHEGGIATPFIAHWPEGTNVLPGSLHHTPWQLPDVMASIVEIAGALYPASYKGNELHPLEGKSFAPVFSDLDIGRDGPLYWEHEGKAGVRLGSMKLVRNYALNSELAMDDPAAWELYDLQEDRTELRNLAGARPNRVREMLDAYLGWARRCNVMDYNELRSL